MTEEIKDSKAVFKTKVNERLALHPAQWAGDDSVEVVRSIVTSLKDANGTTINLTPEEDEVLKLASRPTLEGQMSVIGSIVANHNAKLDPTVAGLVRRVVSPAAFKIELVKAGKIKDASSSGLNDLLG